MPVGKPHHLQFLLGLAATLAVATTATSATIKPNPPSQVCIGTACATSPANPSGEGIKWHPGHYMSIRGHRKPDIDLPNIDALANEPLIVGILVEWRWADLEKSKGVYDFSQIDTYLKRLKALPTKKRMIIRIEERGFGTPTATSHAPIPSYLQTDPAYGGGEVNFASGTVARIWLQPVMDRYIALFQALGAKYDADPYVEGIGTEETTIGFYPNKSPAPSDFSFDALTTQLKRLVAASRDAWPHSNVFVQTNYLGNPGQMEDLIKSLAANQGFAGGPDTNPASWVKEKGLSQGERVMNGTAGTGTDYRSVIGVKNEFQVPDFRAGYPDATPAGVWATAWNDDHAHYMVWDRYSWSTDPRQNWSTGILPFIRSIKGQTYTACPSSFPRCITD
jgi:hypothetical protein